MTLRNALLRFGADACHGSGLASAFSSRYGGVGAIFALHSLVADDDPLPRDNLQTSVSFLDRMLGYYAGKAPIVTLSEALARLRQGEQERFLCFTFDDGYRDNLTLALSAFKRHNAPFTVYASSAHLERRVADYWQGQLRHVIRDASVLRADFLPSALPIDTLAAKRRAYATVSNAVQRGTIQRDQLDALFEAYGVSEQTALERDMATPEELRRAAQSEPLLEVGGHTHNHAPLRTLDANVAFADIARNKADLETLLGREVKHFAFPFGDRRSCGPREFDLAKRAGYHSATTMRVGNLFPAHADNPWALPRLRFIGPCESVGFLEAQRLGAVPAAVTRFGAPVVTV
ncbi:MAG TPA: polysaccharide deacetylase family protein [Caulobacterales bacterium]|nr:polysaccharide deacetylase family protein [Caulobacterales bacterium]